VPPKPNIKTNPVINSQIGSYTLSFGIYVGLLAIMGSFRYKIAIYREFPLIKTLDNKKIAL